MDSDFDLIDASRRGDLASFEALVVQHQRRVFGIARRYARREADVEDIVQDVFIKAHQKLAGFRGDAPFEHWLVRLTVRVCYDYLRSKKQNREIPLCDINDEQNNWLERFLVAPESVSESAAAASEIIGTLLARLSPASRLVIQLLEIEERSVKQISELTGWSVTLVKVRAFRARREMRRHLQVLLAAKKM